mmetsp:Transcript_10501/g.32858  ORF Transcript_10501/g.32858 Transcript_10501/m.32858 type:complete len:222 (+) Transcript_10501:1122-1787(+)
MRCRNRRQCGRGRCTSGCRRRHRRRRRSRRRAEAECLAHHGLHLQRRHPRGPRGRRRGLLEGGGRRDGGGLCRNGIQVDGLRRLRRRRRRGCKRRRGGCGEDQAVTRATVLLPATALLLAHRNHVAIGNLGAWCTGPVGGCTAAATRRLVIVETIVPVQPCTILHLPALSGLRTQRGRSSAAGVHEKGQGGGTGGEDREDDHRGGEPSGWRLDECGNRRRV